MKNFTYDELSVGQSGGLEKTVTAKDVLLFAAVTGDTNPAHLDPEYAEQTMFKGVIAHGMYSAGLISAVLGTRFPGPGTIYLGQDLQFKRPVNIGDTLTVTLTVADKRDDKKIVTLACEVVNQDGKVVVTGNSTIIAPAISIEHELLCLGEVAVPEAPNEHFAALL
ncbi:MULTISPECIES: MaoC/PaaZ C-terminal domain-containing protein [Vitreoscilla]|uniref:MaoC family dehydratase N-terminal domain-containing protein n=1 Tax=Vitreoscilla stercoraria TaxID=61 RepID=A0ABY4ECE5_VITST|nr:MULTISPECIES: MaoC/PaaZ C-terminal domain-containing protein [Vitreoscilla]AUZ06434.1 putative hydratase [Vitreoscilla sp. C1]UOO92283.1 MaoC family dehydratase N-terminal domain-containing protein [Vitreoscilla stercoraria]